MNGEATATGSQGRTGRYHHGDLRAALIRAAEFELKESGIEGFSLRAVAKRAGVSHAAPAHHFTDVGGLLTALAAEGFRRFVATQLQAMEGADPDPSSQLAAAGLGYVRFAMGNPDLFRLIFSSGRPDFEVEELNQASGAAFEMLSRQVAEAIASVPGAAPATPLDVAATWSMAHGIADLLASGRLNILTSLPEPEREKAILALLRRAFSKPGG